MTRKEPSNMYKSTPMSCSEYLFDTFGNSQVILMLLLIFSELQAHYPQLMSLRTLTSGIPIPREGEDGKQIAVTIAPSLPISESALPGHWPSLLLTLKKIQGEGNFFSATFFHVVLHLTLCFTDVLQALTEIDHLSSRKPSVLETITDNLTELLVSPQGNVRNLAHALLARAMKHKPAPNLNILSAFHRCLDSPRADVLMSALERLSDIVLCMQGKIKEKL